MAEHAEQYESVRIRIDDLVRGTGGSAPVPTCPGWSVRDVVAHLAGLCQDWVSNDLLGYASDEWTAKQVARYAGRGVDDILDAWRDASVAFAALPDDELMGPPARWSFGDAVSHEADIRHALGAGRVPDDAVALSVKAAIARWRSALAEAATPTLRLHCPGVRDWWLGVPDDPATVDVTAPLYDVFRALAGRRSAAQVTAWEWSADPTPFIVAGIGYPFAWATTDIID